MTKKGERVGAMISSDPELECIEFAGYRVYEGDEIPPKGIEIMGMDLHELQHTNPKINLDNGKIIWGCQCWWGPETAVKKHIQQALEKGYTIHDWDD